MKELNLQNGFKTFRSILKILHQRGKKTFLSKSYLPVQIEWTSHKILKLCSQYCISILIVMVLFSMLQSKEKSAGISDLNL